MISAIPPEINEAKKCVMQITVEAMDDRGNYPDSELQKITKLSKKIYDLLCDLEAEVEALK